MDNQTNKPVRPNGGAVRPSGNAVRSSGNAVKPNGNTVKPNDSKTTKQSVTSKPVKEQSAQKNNIALEKKTDISKAEPIEPIDANLDNDIMDDEELDFGTSSNVSESLVKDDTNNKKEKTPKAKKGAKQKKEKIPKEPKQPKPKKEKKKKKDNITSDGEPDTQKTQRVLIIVLSLLCCGPLALILCPILKIKDAFKKVVKPVLIVYAIGIVLSILVYGAFTVCILQNKSKFKAAGEDITNQVQESVEQEINNELESINNELESTNNDTDNETVTNEVEESEEHSVEDEIIEEPDIKIDATVTSKESPVNIDEYTELTVTTNTKTKDDKQYNDYQTPVYIKMKSLVEGFDEVSKYVDKHNEVSNKYIELGVIDDFYSNNPDGELVMFSFDITIPKDFPTYNSDGKVITLPEIKANVIGTGDDPEYIINGTKKFKVPQLTDISEAYSDVNAGDTIEYRFIAPMPSNLDGSSYLIDLQSEVLGATDDTVHAFIKGQNIHAVAYVNSDVDTSVDGNENNDNTSENEE